LNHIKICSTSATHVHKTRFDERRFCEILETKESEEEKKKKEKQDDGKQSGNQT
jgi:hypothetical protein